MFMPVENIRADINNDDANAPSCQIIFASHRFCDLTAPRWLATEGQGNLSRSVTASSENGEIGWIVRDSSGRRGSQVAIG